MCDTEPQSPTSVMAPTIDVMAPTTGAMTLTEASLLAVVPFPSEGNSRRMVTDPYEILVKRAIRGTYQYKGSTKKRIQNYIKSRYCVDRCYKSYVHKALQRLKCMGYIYPYQRSPLKWKLNLKGYFMKANHFFKKKKGKRGGRRRGKRSRRTGKRRRKNAGRRRRRGGKKHRGKSRKRAKTASLQEILCGKKKKSKGRKRASRRARRLRRAASNARTRRGRGEC